MKLAGIIQAQLEDAYGPDSSQNGPRVHHRIAWARTLLKQVDQLRSVSPGVWAIADQGSETLVVEEADSDSLFRTASKDAQQASAPDGVLLDSWQDASDSGHPESISVRDLILLWGVRRRWAGASARIESLLAERDLRTEPDFSAVGLDVIVSLVSTKTLSTKAAAEQVHRQVTRTIGQLPAASGGVVYVNPQSRLSQRRARCGRTAIRSWASCEPSGI